MVLHYVGVKLGLWVAIGRMRDTVIPESLQSVIEAGDWDTTGGSLVIIIIILPC